MPVLEGRRRTKPGHHAIGRPIPRGCATGAADLAWRKHANFRTEHSAGLMWARLHPLPTLGHPFAQVASENSKAPLCQSLENKASGSIIFGARTCPCGKPVNNWAKRSN